MRTRIRLIVTIMAVFFIFGACSGGDNENGASIGRKRAQNGKLTIVTTVAPITSIAANVVGDRAELVGVVPEGTNSHTFEPSPSAAETLSTADLVFINGLALEEPIKKLAETNLKDGAELVELGNLVLDERDYIYDFSFPRDEGKPNPHLWTDPTFAKRYAEVIKDKVSEADSQNASAYEANYQAFVDVVDRFDAALRQSFATLPKERRKLLTYHDAYTYFAQTYDWKVIGAIQVSDFKDPSPKEVAALIDQVRAEGVPAIFGSEVFPSPVLEQIGKEAGVRYVDVLRDDDLPGQPGDPEHSWLGLMRFDYKTMVETLGGDPSAIESFEVKNVAPDVARYPQ